MPVSSISFPSDSTSALHAHVDQETEAFLGALGAELQKWFDHQRQSAVGIDPAACDLVEAIAGLSISGKRLRAQLLYWGWRAAGGDPLSVIPVQAAAGIELFQTAALIHDDVIDRSDTRRSMPSVHKQLEEIHSQNGWDQDPAHFGISAAVLIGDLALTWSEQVFSRALALAGYPEKAAEDFHRMRTEVMIGQYLDVHAEVAAAQVPLEDAYHRALQILRFKSAKYSAEHPVVLGFLLAGGTDEKVEQYREFALALGEAFQIRDDVLGIFGDPTTTGKPAGDDLREGKRTVVIAVHMQLADTTQKSAVSQVLGNAEATDAQIAGARTAITSSGALHTVEQAIQQLSQHAAHGIDALEMEPTVATAFRRILQAAVHRDH